MAPDKQRGALVVGSVIAVGISLGVLSGRRKKSGIPRDVVSRPWEDRNLVPGALTMSVPWPIKARSDPQIPANVTIMIGEQFDSVMSVTTVAGATDAPLERLADDGLAGVDRLPGFRLLSSEKRPASLLGKRALDFSGRFERAQGEVRADGVVLAGDTYVWSQLSSTWRATK